MAIVRRSMTGSALHRQLALAQSVIIDGRQRLAKRIATSDLEHRYQANYFELGHRTPWIPELPISSLKGGTASYSLLFVLLSLLRSGSFTSVLELGVGQSTQLIGPYVACDPGRSSVHVESDAGWLELALATSPRSMGLHAPLTRTTVDGRSIEWYGCERPTQKFDLVLVDGPSAWEAPNRYNRLGILGWLPHILADEFVLCIDDSSRPGERRLAAEAETLITSSRPGVRRATFVGATTQTLLVSPEYQWSIYI